MSLHTPSGALPHGTTCFVSLHTTDGVLAHGTTYCVIVHTRAAAARIEVARDVATLVERSVRREQFSKQRFRCDSYDSLVIHMIQCRLTFGGLK